MFYMEEIYEEFFSYKLDFVVDVFDMILYKIYLMKECLKCDILIILSMGVVNKMDLICFKIVDILKIYIDLIVKVVCICLCKEGICKGINVVFFDECLIVICEEVCKEVGND